MIVALTVTISAAQGQPATPAGRESKPAAGRILPRTQLDQAQILLGRRLDLSRCVAIDSAGAATVRDMASIELRRPVGDSVNANLGALVMPVGVASDRTQGPASPTPSNAAVHDSYFRLVPFLRIEGRPFPIYAVAIGEPNRRLDSLILSCTALEQVNDRILDGPRSARGQISALPDEWSTVGPWPMVTILLAEGASGTTLAGFPGRDSMKPPFTELNLLGLQHEAEVTLRVRAQILTRRDTAAQLTSFADVMRVLIERVVPSEAGRDGYFCSRVPCKGATLGVVGGRGQPGMQIALPDAPPPPRNAGVIVAPAVTDPARPATVAIIGDMPVPVGALQPRILRFRTNEEVNPFGCKLTSDDPMAATPGRYVLLVQCRQSVRDGVSLKLNGFEKVDISRADFERQQVPELAAERLAAVRGHFPPYLVAGNQPRTVVARIGRNWRSLLAAQSGFASAFLAQATGRDRPIPELRSCDVLPPVDAEELLRSAGPPLELTLGCVAYDVEVPQGRRLFKLEGCLNEGSAIDERRCIVPLQLADKASSDKFLREFATQAGVPVTFDLGPLWRPVSRQAANGRLTVAESDFVLDLAKLEVRTVDLRPFRLKTVSIGHQSGRCLELTFVASPSRSDGVKLADVRCPAGGRPTRMTLTYHHQPKATDDRRGLRAELRVEIDIATGTETFAEERIVSDEPVAFVVTADAGQPVPFRMDLYVFDDLQACDTTGDGPGKRHTGGQRLEYAPTAEKAEQRRLLASRTIVAVHGGLRISDCVQARLASAGDRTNAHDIEFRIKFHAYPLERRQLLIISPTEGLAEFGFAMKFAVRQWLLELARSRPFSGVIVATIDNNRRLNVLARSEEFPLLATVGRGGALDRIDALQFAGSTLLAIEDLFLVEENLPSVSFDKVVYILDSQNEPFKTRNLGTVLYWTKVKKVEFSVITNRNCEQWLAKLEIGGASGCLSFAGRRNADQDAIAREIRAVLDRLATARRD